MIFIYLIDRAFLGLMVLEMLAKVVFEMHAFLNLPVLEMPCLYTTYLSKSPMIISMDGTLQMIRTSQANKSEPMRYKRDGIERYNPER